MDPEIETAPINDELLAFFKALADATRLKIIGLLANQQLTVEQLASMLDVSSSTVSHHLARLSEIGLVTARAESYYSVYSLQTDVLEAMARRLLERKNLPNLAEDADIEAYDRKVLRSFLDENGRIVSFPMQQKKFEVLLRYVVKDFEAGRKYTEKEVNEILSHYNDDVASLRRGLVTAKFMARNHGIYWRP
jgi:biotin operon repressor